MIRKKKEINLYVFNTSYPHKKDCPIEKFSRPGKREWLITYIKREELITMRLIKADIDELLESTRDLTEDEGYSFITTIEIDHLLENTQDW